MACDPFFGRHDDRELVAPESFVEIPLQILLRIRTDQPLLLSFEKASDLLLVIERPGQMRDDFRHQRLAGDRIVARDVCSELRGGFAADTGSV